MGSTAVQTAHTVDETWSRVIADLATDDPARAFNLAHEACGRYASDRGRLALIVRNADGTSERWTFFELDRAAARVAAAFADAGLRPGDRVAAVLSRQIETWITAMAVWRAGLVYVPLFVGFGTEALLQRLAPTAPAAVVIDHRWRESSQPALEQLEHRPAVFTVTGARGRGLLAGDRSFWAELERGSAADAPRAQTTASDLATITFTSGTTGLPKGCLITHGGVLALRPYADACFGIGPSDLMFSTSDPGWSYGLYTTGAAVMMQGAARVIYTGDFEPGKWLETIEAEQATFIAGAPSAYRRLLDAIQRRRRGAPGSLRGATSAGEPLDAETAERWQRLTGTPIFDGYGQTEVGMPLTNYADGRRPVVAGSLAGATPGFEVVLLDEHGNEPPTGEEGSIAIRRPPFQLSSGYLDRQPEWDARWHGDLFISGDRARRDEDGRWWFTGRDDDVIVTSGYNVGPVEIESVLLEHPGVADAAAVAEPDAARGSVVRAVIVRTPEAPAPDVLTRELQDAVRARVGRHAYPRIVDFVDELPRTATGKLRRVALRQDRG